MKHLAITKTMGGTKQTSALCLHLTGAETSSEIALVMNPKDVTCDLCIRLFDEIEHGWREQERLDALPMTSVEDFGRFGIAIRYSLGDAAEVLQCSSTEVLERAGDIPVYDLGDGVQRVMLKAENIVSLGSPEDARLILSRLETIYRARKEPEEEA